MIKGSKAHSNEKKVGLQSAKPKIEEGSKTYSKGKKVKL
jgi:hypothetical protein